MISDPDTTCDSALRTCNDGFFHAIEMDIINPNLGVSLSTVKQAWFCHYDALAYFDYSSLSASDMFFTTGLADDDPAQTNLPSGGTGTEDFVTGQNTAADLCTETWTLYGVKTVCLQMKGNFSRDFNTGDDYDLTYDYTTYSVSVVFGEDASVSSLPK